MERKYLLVGRFTSICSTTRNHYRLFKCNRDYLTVDVIIFSKKEGDDHKGEFDRSREIHAY